jgi:hypothetical protein
MPLLSVDELEANQLFVLSPDWQQTALTDEEIFRSVARQYGIKGFGIDDEFYLEDDFFEFIKERERTRICRSKRDRLRRRSVQISSKRLRLDVLRIRR